MEAPEPKFAVIGWKNGYSLFEVVCCNRDAYLIMRFICSMFGKVGNPAFMKDFPFSFSVYVNPVFEYKDVVAYIQWGLEQTNQEAQ